MIVCKECNGKGCSKCLQTGKTPTLVVRTCEFCERRCVGVLLECFKPLDAPVDFKWKAKDKV